MISPGSTSVPSKNNNIYEALFLSLEICKLISFFASYLNFHKYYKYLNIYTCKHLLFVFILFYFEIEFDGTLL
jgi:hypothetical protein